MITEKQILEASGDELSRLAGEVLQPEANKHRVASEYGTTGSCCKCLKVLDWTRWSETCDYTDPIPLTWDSAMQRRDWAVEEFNNTTYNDALIQVYISRPKELHAIRYDVWLACYAQPSDYIKAACICKVRSKK